MPGVGRLIVGTSGSPGSLRALRYAEALARAHNSVLIPAMAWEPPRGDRSGYLREECYDRACRQLRDALTTVWGEVPGDPLVQPRVEPGRPGWVLVNLACRPGDVLVVGAGRRGALRRMAFSQVSRYCLAHAQCPVLAVPPPALARDLRHSPYAWMFWHRPLTAEHILRDHGRPTA